MKCRNLILILTIFMSKPINSATDNEPLDIIADKLSVYEELASSGFLDLSELTDFELDALFSQLIATPERQNCLHRALQNELQKRDKSSTSSPGKTPAIQSPKGKEKAPAIQFPPEPFVCSEQVYTDLSSKVQQQTNATCGYHAVWNLAQIMSYLKTNDVAQANELLKQGPPLSEWQEIIGEHYNIDDEAVRSLAFHTQGLDPKEVTIIPNIREWNPALDENFHAVAQKLHNTSVGAVHGFLINTATHIQIMTPEIQSQILNSIKNDDYLSNAFINAVNQHEILDEKIADEIVKLLWFSNVSDDIKGALRGLNKGDHASHTGHWTAIVARNEDGIIKLYVADSARNQDKEFGSKDVIQRLYDWLTIEPSVLKAITDIPNILDTAEAVIKENDNIEGGRKYIELVKDIIKKTPGLANNRYFLEKINPRMVSLMVSLEEKAEEKAGIDLNLRLQEQQERKRIEEEKAEEKAGIDLNLRLQEQQERKRIEEEEKEGIKLSVRLQEQQEKEQREQRERDSKGKKSSGWFNWFGF